MTETKYTMESIKCFIIEKTGCDYEEVTANCDIIYDLGCYGDDLSELIYQYKEKYNVNLENYLWYFHTEEEGHLNLSIGRAFFKPPYERVKHIPLTPALLLDSANEGKWLVAYPEHSLPRRRYDIVINQVVILVFIIFFIFKCAK